MTDSRCIYDSADLAWQRSYFRALLGRHKFARTVGSLFVPTERLELSLAAS